MITTNQNEGEDSTYMYPGGGKISSILLRFGVGLLLLLLLFLFATWMEVLIFWSPAVKALPLSAFTPCMLELILIRSDGEIFLHITLFFLSITTRHVTLRRTFAPFEVCRLPGRVPGVVEHFFSQNVEVLQRPGETFENTFNRLLLRT